MENCETPVFWQTESSRLNEFKEKYGNKYCFVEDRDSFEYIYLRSDLVNLSGKKYHSKRNHIHTFNKNYDWHFELLNDYNKEHVLDTLYELKRLRDLRVNGVTKGYNNKYVRERITKLDLKLVELNDKAPDKLVKNYKWILTGEKK